SVVPSFRAGTAAPSGLLLPSSILLGSAARAGNEFDDRACSSSVSFGSAGVDSCQRNDICGRTVGAQTFVPAWTVPGHAGSPEWKPECTASTNGFGTRG